jgi:hypothetical protein
VWWSRIPTTTTEAPLLLPTLFLATLLLPALPIAAPLVLGQACAIATPGHGRHRRIPVRGRHAARGGAR